MSSSLKKAIQWKVPYVALVHRCRFLLHLCVACAGACSVSQRVEVHVL